ncbi:hypothetical protein HANVADRAFT_53683 [Hanseniaspora valbyensis NRRL Y-1626]|uniref:Uncharacterized protein n=1 Tax=Hanseniaspora valbyensis NRRL Y-1626 TaxID=766949 RepID=A0A1B7TAN0_9ASCO|nr:hypothetical protein HANVADRAFT_53683 [Hanseniaspora valbyensis NRRL Y-1626]
MFFQSIFSKYRNIAMKNSFKHSYSTTTTSSSSSSAGPKYGKTLNNVKQGVFSRVKAMGKKYRNFIIFSGMLQVAAVLADDNKDLHKRYKMKMEKYDEIMSESMKYGPAYWDKVDIEKEFKPIDNLFKEKDERRNLFTGFYKIRDFFANVKNKNKYIEEYKTRELERQENGHILTEKQKQLFEGDNEKLWQDFMKQANSDITDKSKTVEQTNDSMNLTKSELVKGERLPVEIKDLMEKEKKLATYYYDAPIVRVDNGEVGKFAEAPSSSENNLKKFI